MPEKIILADGTEKEVPTKEEFEALQAKAKEAEDAKIELDKIKNDPTEKNWKALREAKEKAQDALKSKGLMMKDDGTIEEIKQAPAFTMEDVDKRASAAALKVAIDARKAEKLSKFKEEDRRVVDYYFNKFSSGEEMDLQKVDKFIDEAALHLSGSFKQVTPSVNGQPPRLPEDNFGKRDSFAETDLGKQLAKEVFGGESYANSKQ